MFGISTWGKNSKKVILPNVRRIVRQRQLLHRRPFKNQMAVEVHHHVVEEPVVHHQIVHHQVVEEPVVHHQVVEEPILHHQVVEEPVVHHQIVHHKVVEEPVVRHSEQKFLFNDYKKKIHKIGDVYFIVNDVKNKLKKKY